MTEVSKSPPTLHFFTEEVVERILDLFMEDCSLDAIADKEGVPYSTLLKWIKNNPGFRERLKSVGWLRAMQAEDAACKVALDTYKNAPDRAVVEAGRLLFDAYKWKAEINDPDRYGKKVTVAGDKDRPIQFIVSTGFPEPNEFQKPPKLGRDGLIEIEASKVVEEIARDESDGTRE